MFRINLSIFSLLFLFTACGEETPTLLPNGCPADQVPGTVEVFATLDDTSEGLVFTAGGRLLVSTQGSPDGLVELFPDGSFAVLHTDDSLLGLAADGGDVFIAAIETGDLLRYNLAAGSSENVASDLGDPNFVALTPWGTVLVSDDFTNRISEVTYAGAATVWSEGVSSPNGMVFSHDGNRLYVASTFEAPGLSEIVVNGGVAGAVNRLADFGEGSSPDGVAIDKAGNIYVALNTFNEVVRVTPSKVTDVVATGVPFGASLGFGRGEFDSCSLYVTSLLSKEISRVFVGEPGY